LFPRSFRGTLSSIGVPALQASLAALGQNAPPGECPVFDPRRSEADRRLSTKCRRISQAHWPAHPPCDTGSLSKLKEVLTVQIRTAWRFGVGVVNGCQLIGVATVGNPVARAFNGRGIVEVNRLCVRRDIVSLLCWNAASMLYGAASRAAERAGFQSIITYTHETEDGASLLMLNYKTSSPAARRLRDWAWGTEREPNQELPTMVESGDCALSKAGTPLMPYWMAPPR